MSNLPYSYPLHASVRARLHPEYVEFYEKYLINLPQAQDLPLSISRAASPIVAGGGTPVPVGSTRDFLVDRRHTTGPPIRVRAFLPASTLQPGSGWPSVLYFHGGGFVFGTIDTENTLCSHLCVRASCIVFTVDYRLAPEDPFPAAVNDCWEVFLWMIETGAEVFNIDISNTAIVGASAGANLAAVTAQKALSVPAETHRFVAQLLVVPLTDSTATIDNNPTWKELQFTASLTAEKMDWYRRQYLPCEEDWSNPEASPLLSPDQLLAQLPPTVIIVAELDILRHEGVQYAQRLRQAGVRVDLHTMPGVPHPFIAMDQTLTAGREGIELLCKALNRAFRHAPTEGILQARCISDR